MLLLLHALIPCFAAYILHLFLYFLALSSLDPLHFNGNVFTLVALVFCCIDTCSLRVYEPHPILLLVVK